MTGSEEYLSYADQAMLLTLRGAAQEAVIQALWFYGRPTDRAALSRFHHRLEQGLFGRRIERSPLPFGRHRWVAAAGAPLTVTEEGVPRASLYEWADRQVDLPLDPEAGPAWRLSATSLADGGSVVSLVVSHCIADGAAVQQALVAAADDRAGGAPSPRPGLRTASHGATADLRRLRSDLPEIGAALRSGARALLRDRRASRRRVAGSPPPPLGDARVVHLPTVSLVGDADEWTGRAQELNGTLFALAAAVATRLAAAVGRERDGAVMLLVPVSERADDDLSGNVVSLAHIRVPARGWEEDLTPLRAALRGGLAAARREPDPMTTLLPLIPFVPRRAMGRLVDQALGYGSDLPVSVSNMGTLPTAVLRADGTFADLALFRGVDRRVSADSLRRRRGVLSVFAGVIGKQAVLTATGWQPGAVTTSSELRRELVAAATDLGVTGEVV